MHRRQQMYSMPESYSMTRATMQASVPHYANAPLYTNAPLYSQELVDDSAMERYQHERYLQQAREMQLADQQAEKINRAEAAREMSRDVASRAAHEENVTKEKFTMRNSYRAVMRNGELVVAKDGYLMVTHTNMVVSSVQAQMNMSNTSDKDAPLNLSLKDEMTTNHHHSGSHSSFNHSPQVAQDSNTAINLITKVPDMQGVNKIQARGVTILLPPAPGVPKVTKLLPKIAPKPSAKGLIAVQPKDEMLKEDTKYIALNVEPSLSTSPTLPPDVLTLFPHLKTTNSGSLVLWNFLWALLKDENYKKIATWVSFPNLRFRIVNPSMLAPLWGQVKQNPSMDWFKIKKILDLYLRKNLIVSSGTTNHVFTFLIVPKSIKESLKTEK